MPSYKKLVKCPTRVLFLCTGGKAYGLTHRKQKISFMGEALGAKTIVTLIVIKKISTGGDRLAMIIVTHTTTKKTSLMATREVVGSNSMQLNIFPMKKAVVSYSLQIKSCLWAG